MSCHQKRVLIWSEWLLEEVLEDISHTQLVFSIPKALRNALRHSSGQAFHRNRKLLGGLSVCAAETIKQFIREAFEDQTLQPGIVSCIHSFGDQARWNPHLHILCTSGGFDKRGTFYFLSSFPTQEMTFVFREKVFQMLIDAHFLSEHFAAKMRAWRWSGFAVHQSLPVAAADDQSMGRLVQYISRAPFSLARLEYEPQKGVVIFHSKKDKKQFDPIEFIFRLFELSTLPKFFFF